MYIVTRTSNRNLIFVDVNQSVAYSSDKAARERAAKLTKETGLNHFVFTVDAELIYNYTTKVEVVEKSYDPFAN